MELQNRNKSSIIVLVNVCRWVLALVMMLSGFLKAVDPVGAMYKFQEYASILSPFALADDWLMVAAVVQSALEFLVGLFLLVGIYRGVVSFLALLAMLLFTPVTFYIWWSGSIADCGCFGESVVLSNGATFAKNVFLLLFAFVTFWGRSMFVGRMSRKTRWMLVLFSIVYVVGLQMVGLLHLPLVDYGNYAVGNNLRQMVEPAPGEYRLVSVYQKDGEEALFPADSIPAEGWEFVKTYSEQVKAGSEPEINNFSILDWETDIDIADELLADTGLVCVVPIERVETASVTHIDKINDLYDYCVANAIRFCAVSSSDEAGLLSWVKRTGAEYPIFWADEAMLRSMIHTNPGLLLLSDGVVVGKWAAADIPDVEKLAAPSDLIPDTFVLSYANFKKWPFWVLLMSMALFALSLFDVTLVGIGRRRRKKAASKIAASAIDEKNK